MFCHPDEVSERERRSLAEAHPLGGVAIVGAPGSGAGLGLTLLGSIFAPRVHLLADAAEGGADAAARALERAAKMARSHIVRERGRAHGLEEGLEAALRDASIVFVLTPRGEVLERVSALVREDALIFIDPGEATLEAILEQAPALSARALGLRLFGPPHLIAGAELLRMPALDEARLALGADLLAARFGLLAIEVRDRPLGLARRLETKLLNEAAKLAEVYPVVLIDAALAGETGRPLGALAQLDAIGWTNHRRRANLISEEEGDARLSAPSYMNIEGVERRFFSEGEDGERLALDLPSGRYLAASSFDIAPLAAYRAASEFIEVGRYRDALEELMNSNGDFPRLTRELLAVHLVDAFDAVARGEIGSVRELDRLVGAAIGWVPPGALVDLIGADRTRALITEAGLAVPVRLSELRDDERLHSDPRLSPGAYFSAQASLRG